MPLCNLYMEDIKKRFCNIEIYLQASPVLHMETVLLFSNTMYRSRTG